MKLLIQSAMIFFGTLMAAGFVALGEPAGAGLALSAKAPVTGAPAPVLVSARTSSGQNAAPGSQR